MIDADSTTAAEVIAQFLAAPESKRLEFKRISSKHGRMIETVCAFANSEGGILVIGVADEKGMADGSKAQARLFGIEENPEAFDDFRRECLSRFAPAISKVRWWRFPCTLRDGNSGHVVMLVVDKSEEVHSVVGGGTWQRMDASNRQMEASEIAELHYQRGVRSATAETVPIDLALLETNTWKQFLSGRGLRSEGFANQLLSIGLACKASTEVFPTRAAVLLFADEPGSLLAAQGSRSDIRIMVYDGKQPIPGATPNLRKTPKTIRGPLVAQIETAVNAVLDELAQGLTLSGSGFKTRHLYPERVVKEAIVNAVIHRDYRLNRDIFIRIFDDRIEVESPGLFPGSITAANIGKAGSKARNPLLAQNLREFPTPPNIDAGEGVKMMFAEMAQANLYPPQYRQNTEVAVESVTVTLLNLERPTAWDEVSDWIDRHGSIANADLVRIAKLDTLKASKLFGVWREQGLLVPLPGRGKKNMAYTKPAEQGDGQQSLLSSAEEIK